MLHFLDSLLVLSFLLLFVSPVYGCDGASAVQLGAWVEHPDVYECLLEAASPESEHGNIQLSSIVSDGSVFSSVSS